MTLNLHSGGEIITRERLAQAPVPEGTDTWHPIAHVEVLDKTEAAIRQAGFEIVETKLALHKDDLEFFGTMQLSSVLCGTEALTVGIRNSNNRRYPIGMCVGRRVFVCSNLAFSSDIVVSKRHTRFGKDRYVEGIHHAVAQLGQFQEIETKRIETLQATPVTPTEADALMLRAAEQGVIGWRQLPQVIEEWRNPEHEEHSAMNRYCLLQAFTAIMRERFEKHPLKAAHETIAIQNFLTA